MTRGACFLLALAACAEPPPPAFVPPPCAPCLAEIVLFNEMGPTFALTHARLAIEGLPTWERADDRLVDERRVELVVPDLGAGNHHVQLDLDYRGRGYGVFSYLSGYKFHVKSTFEAAALPRLRLEIHAYEKGGITTPLEERPAVRWVQLPVR